MRAGATGQDRDGQTLGWGRGRKDGEAGGIAICEGAFWGRRRRREGGARRRLPWASLTGVGRRGARISAACRGPGRVAVLVWEGREEKQRERRRQGSVDMQVQGRVGRFHPGGHSGIAKRATRRRQSASPRSAGQTDGKARELVVGLGWVGLGWAGRAGFACSRHNRAPNEESNNTVTDDRGENRRRGEHTDRKCHRKNAMMLRPRTPNPHPLLIPPNAPNCPSAAKPYFCTYCHCLLDTFLFSHASRMVQTAPFSLS